MIKHNKDRQLIKYRIELNNIFSNLIGRALTPFHFNVFLKNVLIVPIKKNHFLLVGSKTPTTYNPLFQYILKSWKNVLIQNYVYSNAEKYKQDTKSGTHFYLTRDIKERSLKEISHWKAKHIQNCHHCYDKIFFNDFQNWPSSVLWLKWI